MRRCDAVLAGLILLVGCEQPNPVPTTKPAASWADEPQFASQPVENGIRYFVPNFFSCEVPEPKIGQPVFATVTVQNISTHPRNYTTLDAGGGLGISLFIQHNGTDTQFTVR
jgi:hypothetical protein